MSCIAQRDSIPMRKGTRTDLVAIRTVFPAALQMSAKVFTFLHAVTRMIE